MTTESIPGLGEANGIFVRADGTRLITTTKNTLALHLPPSGMLATIAGNKDDEDAMFQDGQGTDACFGCPSRMTVDLGLSLIHI